ncbi:MAG: dihydroxy-acid dehydratase, partial [Pseudomonadota bacterium]
GAATTSARETTEVASEAVTVRFRDSNPAPVAGLQSTEWRGFFDVNGRLATVAVRGLSAAPLGTDDGEVLLARTIAAVRQANAQE